MSKNRSVIFIGLTFLALIVGVAVLFPRLFPRDVAGKGPVRSSTEPGTVNSDVPPKGEEDRYYCLLAGDLIAVSVLGNRELSGEERIDRNGEIHIPLLGTVKLAGRRVSNAEDLIEAMLIDKRMIRKPTVKVVVRSFGPKEATLAGAVVRSGGTILFPAEKESMELVELIASAGGFKPLAKSSQVHVTRPDGRGGEGLEVVDVDRMMEGGDGAPHSYLIYPGDRVYVAERLY